MKIALLIDSLTSAGAQRQLIILANGLSERGHSVRMFVYHDNTQLLGELDTHAIKLIKVIKRKKLDLSFLFRLISAFRQFKPDVIISFLTGPNLWARLCGPLASTTAIITSERNTNIVDSKVNINLEKLLHFLSTRIVVNTTTAKSQLVQFAHIPEWKIAVVYNGVDTRRFRRVTEKARSRLRRSYGWNDDEFVIVLPGRIEQQKNHLCLIEAIGQLEFDVHRIQVKLYGNENDTTLKQEIVARINRLGLDNRVQFCGPSNSMPIIYNIADVIVLPSHWEGLPNVVLEAMACETPVIVSDVADNRLIVSSGKTGFLFDKNDPKKLAAALLNLIESTTDFRRELGIAARSWVEEKFSISAYINGFRKVIDEALN